MSPEKSNNKHFHHQAINHQTAIYREEGLEWIKGLDSESGHGSVLVQIL